MWDINLYDSGPQTLTVNLKGLVAGIATVSVSGLYRTKGKAATKVQFSKLVNTDQITQVSIVFNPNSRSVSFQPVVGNETLLND